MPLTVELPGPSRAGGDRGAASRSSVSCVFVNNMPDSAFVATERQFLGLLEAASGGLDLEVRCYAAPGIVRGLEIASRIDARYFPFAALGSDHADAVLVTGAEPVADRLEGEPCFSDLVRVVEWAGATGASVLASCLAAHVALLARDGLHRTRLAAKRTGVFAEEVTGAHPLGSGIAEPVQMPHSRWNDVASTALRRSGYSIVLEGERSGWSVAVDDRTGPDIVLLQGHLEYDPSSLLREYRRDAERFLTGARPDLPQLPQRCAAPSDLATLDAFQHRLATFGPATGEDARDGGLAAVGFEEMAARAPWPWRPAAVTVYEGWLARIVQRRVHLRRAARS